MPEAETSKDLSAPAERLVSLAREELGQMSARRRAEGFLKLNARRVPAARRLGLALRVAAVVAGTALVVFGYRWFDARRAPALSYALEGGRIDSNGAVTPLGIANPTLKFSDGTEVVFSAGARARVRSVGSHGARVALNGKVDVAVVPSSGSDWLFDAGPFVIRVTGTTFTADWRDSDERLEVVLRTGSIAVSSPLSPEPISLRAGQRLIVSARAREVIIRNIDAVAEASAVSPRAEGAPLATPEPLPPSAAVLPSASAAPKSNWATELAAGRFKTILAEAEERGLDAVVAEVSSGDLALLSDAARYSRRDDVARRALTAQRRRFPGSARASDAAFLLGRLEEASGKAEVALGWYERYLEESASGTYTSEALGRKMTVVQRLHGAERARPIAEEYLRRFGNGTYAAAARALIRAP